MGSWGDILVPGAAILALLGVLLLVLQSIRHGRAIRRIEENGVLGPGSSTEVSLKRLEELQASMVGRSRRRPQLGGRGFAAFGVVGLLAVGAAAGWWFVLRDDGGGPSAAASTERTTPTSSAGPPAPPPPPGAIPATVPELENKAAFTVVVLNASGVLGAARSVVGPKVSEKGYVLGTVDNAPPTLDPNTSVVMYARGRRNVGLNVAKDLGIKKAVLLDGIDAGTLGPADVVVIVGLDLARG